MFKKTKVETNPEEGSVMVQSLELIEEVVSETTTPTVVYTNKAYGLFKDDSTGHWFVAVVEYNKETGEVGNFTKNIAGPDRIYGIEAFKIRTMNDNLFRD